MRTLRNDFAWGCATAAHQIEGSPSSDGKSPGVWDHFSAAPGKTRSGETGAIACDHYRRFEQDLDLMAELGIKDYRFSVAWTRVIPDGEGAVNEAGLDFYDRLVDAMLARGIKPWCTLFHWCYPQALQQRGGWLNARSPGWFARYAEAVAGRLGDRVEHWMTLNEPQMFVNLGHEAGTHAPGLRLPTSDLARIIHHVLLAHGRGVEVLRQRCVRRPCIGWASAVGVIAVQPDSESDPEVVSRASGAQFAFDPRGRIAEGSSIWCDPVFLGSYPESFASHHGRSLPSGWENDLKVIASPIDFCGLNIYAAWTRFERDAEGRIHGVHDSAYPAGSPRTFFQWPVTPEALYWGPRYFHERYGKPIVITENGITTHDWVSLDGCVHDPQRIDFTRRYLRELLRAHDHGVDVRGYFHWSFMDNFEWAEGYHQRFGLVHVDFASQVRTPKDSALWYREVIASHGSSL